MSNKKGKNYDLISLKDYTRFGLDEQRLKRRTSLHESTRADLWISCFLSFALIRMSDGARFLKFSFLSLHGGQGRSGKGKIEEKQEQGKRTRKGKSQEIKDARGKKSSVFIHGSRLWSCLFLLVLLCAREEVREGRSIPSNPQSPSLSLSLSPSKKKSRDSSQSVGEEGRRGYPNLPYHSTIALPHSLTLSLLGIPILPYLTSSIRTLLQCETQ